MCPLVQGVCLVPFDHHALSLSPASVVHGDVVTCHNKLQDTLAEACHRAHLNVTGGGKKQSHPQPHPQPQACHQASKAQVQLSMLPF